MLFHESVLFENTKLPGSLLQIPSPFWDIARFNNVYLKLKFEILPMHILRLSRFFSKSPNVADSVTDIQM